MNNQESKLDETLAAAEQAAKQGKLTSSVRLVICLSDTITNLTLDVSGQTRQANVECQIGDCVAETNR